MTWQPIETAPSMQWVLLWTPANPLDAENEWSRSGAHLNDDSSGYETEVQWVGYRDARGFWNGYYSGTNPETPTHWKPLEDPPGLP